MKKKKGQISTEYIIIISFITFVVLSIIGVALFYSSQIQESIKFGLIENIAQKVTSSAEAIYYSGEPSRITLTLYIPRGVKSIEIANNDLIFSVSALGGDAKLAYSRKVPIEGVLTSTPGIKKIKLVALQDRVLISN